MQNAMQDLKNTPKRTSVSASFVQMGKLRRRDDLPQVTQQARPLEFQSSALFNRQCCLPFQWDLWVVTAII